MNEFDRNYFVFAGVSCMDFGVYVNGSKTFNAPERAIESKAIPGRHGDLIIDTGRFNNLPHSYEAFAVDNFRANIRKLLNHLLSKPGYQRLEDSYHPDEFYLASYTAGMEVSVTPDLHAGVFTITFNRKPQRFLKSGERKITFLADGSIFNPTDQVASPLIRVYGMGSITVGTETINITSNTDYIDLDCDIEDAYMGTTNCNSQIELQSGDFPKLAPGQTGVVLGQGITKVEIIPRWWRV